MAKVAEVCCPINDTEHPRFFSGPYSVQDGREQWNGTWIPVVPHLIRDEYVGAGGIMRLCGSADVTTCKMRMLMRMKIRILPMRVLIEAQIWVWFSTEIVGFAIVVERIALKLFFFALNIMGAFPPFHWATRPPTGDPFPMERIWATNRWPTGGRKVPGRQTPALSRISKNRRAGNFYTIWDGAQILKIDGRFDLYE